MTVADALFDADALHAAAPAASATVAGGGHGHGPGGAPPATSRGLTAAQTAAVEERSRSLIVGANAGSGKTSVLVERFVRAVLDDGVDPARILAITFTDKAAGELRERLRARFLELGAREAARAVEGAFVSTIHGFCARLLRAHAPAAGLDPAFGVLDEPRAARLREAAFDRALAAFLRGQGREEALDLVAAYGADRLRRAISATHDALRSDGQTAPRLPDVAPRPRPVAEREALRAAHAVFAAELASAGDGATVGNARTALDECARFMEDVELGVVPWPGRLTALKVVCGSAAALKTDACTAYVEAYDAFLRACADHHAARACVLLGELLAGYDDAYDAAKRERGALDFDDLELIARDVLEGNPAVRAAWAERFALVMVDEFQDTNRRQLALLTALDRGNVFTVGDEFQSIYGFRHADVEIFRARRAELAREGAALSLADNFRTRPEILDVLNAVFAPRFGRDFVALGAGREPAGGDEPRVELLVSDLKGFDDEDSGVELGDTLPPAQRWRHAEARLVAQRVRELVDAEEAHPGQVAVLVRATAAIPVFERALAEVGLPTLASAGRGFWSRQEVVDLVAYLTALANPLSEPALLGVLASPLAGVSLDALAVAVRAGRELGRGVWWTLRAAYADGEEAPWRALLPAADDAALAAFAARFVAERDALARHSLDELLERAVLASAYDLHVLGLPGGVRRMANVDKLLRLARDFEAAEGRDLRAFVDHAAALELSQAREPEAPVEDPDEQAVRLMTIHAAKGLEFDVTVVADLGRRGNMQTPDLLVDGDLVGLRLVQLDGANAVQALDFDELKDRRQLADAEEERRVLYVALTRARERLILSGSSDPASWPREAAGAPPLSWLGPALVPDIASRLAAATPETAVTAVRMGEEGDGPELRLTLSAPATAPALLRPDLWATGADAPAPAGAPGAPGAEVPAAAPPDGAPDAPLPTALSYTALSQFESCAYRFYAQRVLRLPDVPAPASLPSDDAPAPGAPRPRRGALDGRERGVLVHALLEELDPAAAVPPPPARVRAVADGLGLRVRDADVEEAIANVAAFASGPLAARLAAATRVEHELEFVLAPARTDEALLTGALDLLAVEPDGTWLVVDAKTDRVAPDADLGAVVEREYAIQRSLYALAALRAGAPRVEVAYTFLARPSAPVSSTFAPADEPALAARIGALTALVAARRFVVTSAPHAALCATCPARGTLCPYPPELTLRRAPVPEVAA